MSALKGFPPKLIWIRIGNCTTVQIEALLRSHFADIEQMKENPQSGILSLF
jgi:predicted nuclease of predicted toxin-antitoxin system